MPRNPYFKFKKFSVRQDRCAMKVSSDACAFGAWIQLNDDDKRILDIGSGTGLLSLMVAQRFPGVEIHAIEADHAAMIQSQENFQMCSFPNAPMAFYGYVQSYAAPFLYDAVFTNPPFFRQSLKSPDEKVSKAKHDTELTLEALVAQVERLLKSDGHWHVLLPVSESEKLDKISAAYHWYPVRKTELSHRPGKEPVRRMTTFARFHEAIPPVNEPETLYIFNDEGKKYNESYVSLMKDFYLAF